MSSTSILFEPKKMIKSIEMKRCIWDPSDEDYMNRTAKQIAWCEVGRDIDEDWDKRNKEQRAELVITAQKKWRHLRDYYVKEKKRGKLEKNRNTQNFDLLGFLSNVEHKHRDSRIEIKSERSFEVEMDDSSEDKESVHSDPKYEASMHEIPYIEPTAGSSEDPDKGFLMSLLPEMRAMNDVEKFNFKYEVMTVLKKLRYSDSDPFK